MIDIQEYVHMEINVIKYFYFLIFFIPYCELLILVLNFFFFFMASSPLLDLSISGSGSSCFGIVILEWCFLGICVSSIFLISILGCCCQYATFLCCNEISFCLLHLSYWQIIVLEFRVISFFLKIHIKVLD